MRGILMAGVWLWLVAPSSNSQAQDAFYHVSLESLELTEGTLPRRDEAAWDWRQWRRRQAMAPYAAISGPGEIYLELPSGAIAGDLPPRDYQNWHVAVRAPRGTEVVGTIRLPSADAQDMPAVRFRIPRDKSTSEARERFFNAKERHYQSLVNRGLPGGAWFRHQAAEARSERTGKPTDILDAVAGGATPPARGSLNQLDDSYAVFTGGRAISENLQLDRTLMPIQPGQYTEPVESIRGITIAAVDWKALLKDSQPTLDLLAGNIPHDQHAIFFPTFSAMITMMDEVDRQGTPLLHLTEARAEDFRTRDFYEQQLCLSATTLARLLGPKVIASVAVTGSDPYLRTGTDLAILFEAKQPQVLTTYIATRYAEAIAARPETKKVAGEAAGTSYSGVRSPDRAVSSYTAAFDNVIVVANSLAQLQRLSAVQQGAEPSLKTLPEFAFFRQRYPSGAEAETALLVLSDATIRRWCGPRWRIASSRRTRAAAILAELQSRYADRIARGAAKPSELTPMVRHAGLGDVNLLPDGVHSSVYGSLRFLTPIIELDLKKVSPSEASAYERFRNSYQRNWQQFFDPIAVRFAVRRDKLAADLTVIPLIVASEYRELIDVTRGGQIPADAGDLHEESILNVIFGLDLKSRAVEQANALASTVLRELRFQPFSWVGNTIGLYFDDDPFWDEFAKAKERERFVARNLHRLPLALRVDVADSLKATLFLAALRAFVEQTAPNLTRWESVKHGEFSYVRIRPENPRNFPMPDQLSEDFAIYYAVAPGWLVVTPNEQLLKRAIDRHVARTKADKEGKSRKSAARVWLGKNVGVQANRRTLTALETLFHEEYRLEMQARAWANLPILNEWKRLYPDRDPLEIHAKLWSATLRCPGGGTFVWNDMWQTMESTVYGHPGAPKPGPAAPPQLRDVADANFGLTFEHNGLRAQVEMHRAPAE
jgi:hypothetical protein